MKQGRDYRRAETCLARLILEGGERLASGERSLDVVQSLVGQMEASGLFVAGRGSAPNHLAQVELDASLMDGPTGRAGAVAAMQGIASAISAARLVMDASPHVLLAGQGAATFAVAQGCTPVRDLALWLTTPDGFNASDLDEGHGTVGATALDTSGRLAAATSTGGTYGALPGRVGDTAVIGAGTWADAQVAVSCTGQGEAFVRVAAASDVARRMAYSRRPLAEAADSVLRAVRSAGGEGGLIAVSALGEIIMPFNTDGMKRAAVSWRTAPVVGAVGDRLREACEVLAASAGARPGNDP